MESSNGSAFHYSEEELKLASYLDDVISAMLARKAMEMFTRSQPDQNQPHRLAGTVPTQPAEAVEMAEGVAEITILASPRDNAGRAAGGDTEPDGDAAADRVKEPDGAQLQEPVSKPSRKRARSSMRAELMELFRNTERTPAPSAEDTVGAAPRPSQAPGRTARAPKAAGAPSPYMRLFLKEVASPPDVHPSGLTSLDNHLGGGFGPGLHILAGEPGVGKTAFLEFVGWETIAARQPVLYYAFKEGVVGTWVRLMSTLGATLGNTQVTLSELRSRILQPATISELASLDRAFQAAVLPWLTLVETFPARVDMLGSLGRDIREKSSEFREKHGCTPLVLIDDVDRLLLLTGSQPLVLTLSRLDDVLNNLELAALACLGQRPDADAALVDLPVQTAICLRTDNTERAEELQPLTAEVRINRRGNWTGVLPLILDRSSGLLAC